MSPKSSSSRYGTVAIVIHWVSAIAILGMLASGLAAENAADDATRLIILRGHATMGVLIGLLTLFRIIWWLAVDTRPADAAPSRLQALAARAVHYGLYGVILVMVASGMATLALSGASAQMMGGAPLPLPDFTEVPPLAVHSVLAFVLMLLLVGHVGAALWHQFIRRDRLLARMGLGS